MNDDDDDDDGDDDDDDGNHGVLPGYSLKNGVLPQQMVNFMVCFHVVFMMKNDDT